MVYVSKKWKKPGTSSISGPFDHGQFARLREGLVPREMEDKWFIY
jgi:hypothetical protein